MLGLDNLRGLSQPEQFHDSVLLPKDAAATNIPLWVLQGRAPTGARAVLIPANSSWEVL